MKTGKTYNSMMIRSVRGTMTRFLAILCIVALGTGFLTGLLSTEPDMRAGADKYFDDQNAMDFLIQGTQGISEENVKAVKRAGYIADADGKYSLDMLIRDENDESYVTRVISEDFSDEGAVNRGQLLEGRIPENEGECAIEIPNGYAYKVDIGEILTIDVQNRDYDDIMDELKVHEFEVVGIVRTPQFIHISGDSSTVGDGTLVMAMYVMEDVFDLDCFTAVYATAEGAKDSAIYTDEYNAVIDDARDSLEDLGKEQAAVRTDQIRNEALEEYNDGVKEYEKEKADAYEKLDDAKAKIDDGRAQIEDGKRQIADGREELNTARIQAADGRKQIADGRQTISDGYAAIADGKQEIEKNKAALDEAQKNIYEGRARIADGRSQIEQAKTETAEGRAQIEAAVAQLEEQEAQVAAQEEQLEAMAPMIEELKAAQEMGYPLTEEQLAMIAAYDEGVAKVAEARDKIEAAKDELAAKEEELKAAEEEIAAKEAELDAGEAELDTGEAQIKAGLAEIDKAEKEIASRESELASAAALLDSKEQELYSAERTIAQSEAEISSNEAALIEREAELNDAEKEYEDAKAEAEEKLADAEQELKDAKEEIDSIEDGKWIIRDRSDNLGMYSFEDDSDKIGAIAKIFPVFFFIIAALVTLTTLTRMVEEERDKIGTLKSLGYSNSAIRRYYMIYGAAASVIGSVIGTVAGSTFFPKVISNAYGMLYVLPEADTPVILRIALPVAAGLTAMILIATWFSTREMLKEKPAELLLPRAPKAGKRILLERIAFFWKPLKFSYKVTLRNIFRYKKRFLMTIIGVAGCFALLLAGFGIRDSIGDIVGIQYGELDHYDYSAVISDSEDVTSDAELAETLHNRNLVSGWSLFAEDSVTLSFNGKKESSTLTVPMDPSDMSEYKTLRERIGHGSVEIGPGKAVLTEKSTENLDVEVGDVITVKTEDGLQAEVELTGICENYVGSYLYMHPSDYESMFGEEPAYTTLLLKTAENAPDGRLAEELLRSESVAYIIDSQVVIDNFEKSVKSIDYIVMVLIAASGALAIIVLYNLTNVNVCERKKELATIRVLGFYNHEVSAYIFREVDILAVLGILVGIPLGIWLHHFVVITVEVAGVMFGRSIEPLSFMIAAGLTIVFTLLVNMIMRPMIRKIDMVESMKAVD